jgi:hypothetical protein
VAIIDSVQQQLGPNEINQISQQLGISPGVAQSAVTAALPMILAGMARHAQQPDGATTLDQAINAHSDVPNDAARVIAAGPPADASTGGGGLLGRILGSHRDTVTGGVQQASGLDADKTKRLLLMLSPILLGILARRQFGGDGAAKSPGALSGTLQQEAQSAAQNAAQNSPHVGGLLGKLLNAVEAPRT